MVWFSDPQQECACSPQQLTLSLQIQLAFLSPTASIKHIHLPDHSDFQSRASCTGVSVQFQGRVGGMYESVGKEEGVSRPCPCRLRTRGSLQLQT